MTHIPADVIAGNGATPLSIWRGAGGEVVCPHIHAGIMIDNGAGETPAAGLSQIPVEAGGEVLHKHVFLSVVLTKVYLTDVKNLIS